MNKLAILIALSVFSFSFTSAQESIPVHFAPDADATKIGALEAVALAVPAEWPANVAAVEGWQPVYYRGKWNVYVENNDIAKDLSVKPGRPYYLEASKSAPQLSIATEKDKTDILSVDTWFCKMRLETIVLGYIPSRSIDAQTIVTNLPRPANNQGNAQAVEAVTEMRGIVAKAGIMGKTRTGLNLKLNDPSGKTLAFLDLSQLPERIRTEELVNQNVSITGTIKEGESGNTLILVAKNLSKPN